MSLHRADVMLLARLAEGRFGLSGLARPQGQKIPRAGGSGNNFLDFAAYGPGDDPRAIDWRASARRGSAVVRRNMQDVSGRWYVLVDCSASMMFGDRWACAADLAAAFAAILIHQGHRVGLVIFDNIPRRFLPPRQGMPHFDALSATLSSPPPTPGAGSGTVIPALTHLAHPAGVVLISDLLWGESLAQDLQAVSAAARRGNVLRLACDADATLPAGAHVLVDAETGVSLSLGPQHVELERDAQWNVSELESRAEQVCCAQGLRYSGFDAGEGWRAGLIAHLRGLAATEMHA